MGLSFPSRDPHSFALFTGPLNPFKNMKTTHLLVTLIAASLPLSALLAEDTAKTEMAAQKQEQNSETTAMKPMDMSQMMSNSKDQDAELDKLVTEMNNASARQKTRRDCGRFDPIGRTAEGDARANAKDDVGQRKG